MYLNREFEATVGFEVFYFEIKRRFRIKFGDWNGSLK